MQVSQDSMFHLRASKCVYMHDEKGEPVIIVEELDEEAADALRRSPYGEGIRLSKDKAQVIRTMYRLGYSAEEYSRDIVTDEIDVSVISNASPELEEHSETIIRALRRKEEIFLESYASEEEFTVAAGIYRGKYELVKFSYNFADETTVRCSAVWEEK